MNGAAPLPQELLRRKRDGEALAAAELAVIATGLADGSLSDAQAAAFAMAVYFRGMTPDERTALTLAMRDSGGVLDWRGESLPGPVLDKHSTGGVGDLVSLPLGPMLAACGAFVPMISGRGLGHTGGTLDKLGAIPGYDVQPGEATLRWKSFSKASSRTRRRCGASCARPASRSSPPASGWRRRPGASTPSATSPPPWTACR